ncbi:MAG: A/G-specific adenine glycosylase [Planctomycetota bacterium]|nr:A/G-specific adenine glycosylase [Planctomycetota bacterium]
MVAQISTALADWYRPEVQKLPWRGVGDPYAIWLSEVMLQQTRVATVIPYWNRFMKKFPDPAALAQAPLGEVLEMWAGLGYYSRGRNLHAAARQIVELHDGSFPRDPQRIRQLPGIGEYTTAAICSIAFDEPLAVIDGNVERVLCRYLCLDGDHRKGVARTRLRDAAQEALDRTHPGDHNQAMMDLGRTICTPRSPDCSSCPLAKGCGAYASGDATRWPRPKIKRATEEQWWATAVVVTRQGVLLWPNSGELLTGHMGTPLVRLDGPDSDADLELRKLFKTLALDLPELIGHADRFQHAITYRKLQVTPLVYRWNRSTPEGVKLLALDAADRVPALHRKAIEASKELLLEMTS